MNLWETLLDTAQHLLMPVNLQIGMQAALHQHSRPTEFDGLANLFVNGFEVKNVSFFSFGSFQRTVEGTKSAVLGAEIRVIDVAIDNVGGHTFGMELAAKGIGLHADADQIIGVKQIESLLLGQGHGIRYGWDNSSGGRALAPNLTRRPSALGRTGSLPVAKVLDQSKNSSRNCEAYQYG